MRSITVEWLVKQFLSQRIDHHISRSRIERNYLFSSGRRRNRCQVGNATNILQYPPALGIREHYVVQQRNQRCTLPANSHIRGTKIRNHWNPKRTRNHSRFACLPCASEPPSGIGFWTCLMKQRLSLG